MTRSKPTAVVAATLAAVAALGALPGAALAQSSRQKSKNDMRNLAIAGAAVAAYGVLSKNKTATIIGAAGAGVGLSQYERQRKAQSEESRDWRDFRRDDPRYRDNGSYRDNGYRYNDYRRDDRDDRRWSRDDRRRGDDRRDRRGRGGCDD
jgi:hypothetical protein